MDWRTEADPRGNVLWKRRRLEVAGRFQYRDRLITPVLRRCPHLVARPLKRDALDLIAIGREVQGIPCNCDLATADTKEATEVDDCCPDLSGSVHNDVDDAPHVLVSSATNFLAKNFLHLAVIENCHGRLGWGGSWTLAGIIIRQPLILRLRPWATLSG